MAGVVLQFYFFTDIAAISATPRELTFANGNFDMSPIMPEIKPRRCSRSHRIRVT